MMIIFWLCLSAALLGLFIGPHWWFAMKKPARVRVMAREAKGRAP